MRSRIRNGVHSMEWKLALTYAWADNELVNLGLEERFPILDTGSHHTGGKPRCPTGG